jgi:alpha-glucosidase
VCLFAISSPAQIKTVDAEGHAWWQHAVFYEIYIRSFADSNNDGIGDVNGIISKLDYLKTLGVDAIWITPCFPSPQVDFGYDVSDYENIDPQYGTLQDFDRLASEARQRGIRIILDFVMNHTSDKHPWFIESKSSGNNPKRNWYMWRDGKGPNQPTNNWVSLFGGSAWKFDATTGQYYYHYFYPEQPDLNWRNPEVEKAMFDVTRWWYARGVSGFRLDAVDTLFEDPQLRENPVQPRRNAYGDPVEENIHNTNLPEVHEELKRLRKVADESGAVLIGETWTPTIEALRQYYGEHTAELQMPMDLRFATVDKRSATEFRRQIAGVDSTGGWPVFLISNHDIVRSYDRYGDGAHNEQIAKLMAAMYLTLRGTPILYYGEELGMNNNDPERKADVKDPIGRLGWPQNKGRDGERTPMQWTAGTNAGFSGTKPWLPVSPAYVTHNVASEQADPSSILNWYKQLLKLRHTDPALLEGKWVPLNDNDENVLVYLRQYKNEAVLVALNMSKKPQKVQLTLAPNGLAGAPIRTLMSTSSAGAAVVGNISLEPFGVFIGRVESAPPGDKK